MNAALRRTWGALLAASILCWEAVSSPTALAQTRPYNPLIRQAAAVEELPPGDATPPKNSLPGLLFPRSVAKPASSGNQKSPSAAERTPANSNSAAPNATAPGNTIPGNTAPRTAPAKFPPPTGTGWRAIKQPGSNRPPLIVPPSSVAQQPYYEPAPENTPSAQPLAQPYPEHHKHQASPEFGATEWNDGPTIPESSSCCGADCGDGCQGDCGGCDSCGWGCVPQFTLLRWLWPNNLSLLAGVHGFKGPVDQGLNGNFGFHEGLNLGGPIKPDYGVGYQVGAQAFQSNFSGDQVVQANTDVRKQLFVTAGLYRRAMQCCHACDWQGGLVVDLLHDDYYVNMTLTQLRGEFSLMMPNRHEIGVWFTAGLETDSATTVAGNLERWESTDLYAFFYRKNLDCGIRCRAWAGFTGRTDALIGGDLQLPVSDDLALQASFNYLLPEEGGSLEGASEESWYLGINLVWYPGCKARCINSQPLFNVADNGTFMVDRRNR